MKSCLDCKDYRACMGKEFYTYGEIRWCPYQVIWIIDNSETLREGDWPDCPEGFTRIDPSIKTGFSDEAYFTKAAYVLGAVEGRLKTTKEAGEALVDEIKEGRVEVIVEDGIIKIVGLSRPAKRALMYIKGRRRKRESYPEWKAGKKYREGKK